MSKIRMVNRHNNESREDETMFFRNKKQAFEKFNEWVQDHLNDYNLEQDDVELTNDDMYDKDRMISISVTEKTLY